MHNTVTVNIYIYISNNNYDSVSYPCFFLIKKSYFCASTVHIWQAENQFFICEQILALSILHISHCIWSHKSLASLGKRGVVFSKTLQILLINKDVKKFEARRKMTHNTLLNNSEKTLQYDIRT